MDNTVGNIKYIGGMDISFKKDSNNVVACLVIHDYQKLELVGVFTMKGIIDIPYKAGFLAFREVPILLKLYENFKKDYPHLVPQVVLIDGNGVWHPRGCGAASHFAVLADIPCVGISKNVLFVDGIDRDSVRNATDITKGSFTDIYDGNNNLIGAAYNVTGSVKKATYINVGSGVSLDKSKEIIKHLSKYRINESVRQADKISRMLV